MASAINGKAEINLPNTKAQKIRLVLKNFSHVPSIYEIIVL